MIELRDIDISFDKRVVYIDHLSFVKGKIYGIFGESGSGKTSILNVLAFKSPIKSGRYLINQKIVKNSLEFSSKHISYIYQQPQFLDDLTCFKNIEIQLAISHNQKTVDEILGLVDLNIDSKVYPQTLSGGEQQKLSLAIALAKDAEILLCDEITASLDQKSKKEIAKLLAKIAHDFQKIVIVASHDSNIEQVCDEVFYIENNTITSNKLNEVNELSLRTVENKMNFSVYFNLIIGTFKKQLMKNGIMFLLIALSISMAVIGIHASKQYTIHFKKLHEFIGSNVSYITNATQFHKFMFENEPIEQEIINQLHGNSNIIAAYPYVAFERFNRVSDISYYLEDEVNSSLAILNENNNSFQNLEIFNYEVEIDGKKESIIDPMSQKENISVHGMVAPCYKEQNLDSKCVELLDDMDGVYLSYGFAKEILNIDKLEPNTTVSYFVSVPISKISYIQNDGKKIDEPLRKMVKVSFPVRGILSPRYMQMMSSVEIYASQDTIEKIMSDTISSITIPQNKTYNTIQEMLDCGFTKRFASKLSFPSTVSFEPYLTGTYCIISDEKISLSALLSDLKQYNSNIEIDNSVQNSLDLSKEFIKKERFLDLYTYIIVIVLIIFCTIHGYLEKVNVKKVSTVLKEMGMMTNNINKYNLYTVLFNLIILLLIGSGILLIGYQLCIQISFISKGMGYQELVKNSYLLFIGLSIVCSVLLNYSRIINDKHK